MEILPHPLINTQILTRLAALTLLFSNSAQCVEWNGGEKWDLFDCPARRAMWVWNPVAVTGTKSDNRSWDPTSSASNNAQARFFENYKGSQDLLLDFCENKSIRVLYFFNAVWEWNMADLDNSTPRVPNEAGFAAFVARANSRGIQVWLMAYLWDAPDDSRMTTVANKQSIKRLAEAVHNFNLAHPTTPLAGVHLDQEPGDTTVYDDLLDTMKIAQDWVNANSPNIIISQALRPKWRNQNITWNGSTKPMNEHIMNTIGHGAYMSYSDDVTVAKDWLTPIINYATTNNKKIASGFEVTDYKGAWLNSDKETWWEEIRNEPLATRFKVDAASPVTFEDGMHDVVNTYQAQSGYDRQVLHDYENYFLHWFGGYPRDYILGLPNGEYVSATQNPAKVNLFQDTRALVGISPFANSPPNTAPTITNIANTSKNEDTATSAIAFTIGDVETAATALTVSGTSSNLTLVPNANIVFGGSGASRTVTVTPAANQTGTSTITVTVSDSALTATDTFVLTVNAVNDAPTITNIADQTTTTGVALNNIAFTVGDVETAATTLTVSRSSSNTTLLPNANIVFGGSGASRTVTVTPAAAQTGTATVTVTVSDGTLTATDTFVLTVNSTPSTFTNWISSFSGLGGLTAFNDDPDGDGIVNGFEAFFGTAPNARSSGLSAVAFAGSALTFTHPEAASQLSNVTGSYQWSLNLTAWNASGVTINGTTVAIGAVKNTPVSGTTTVTASITGTPPGRVFVRAVATQN